jgi:anti-anti-sigma regulatory factor
MAFRISTRRTEGGTVVRIEGRLDAVALRGLVEECRSVGHPLRLDLSGLMSVDADGVRALKALRDQATEFIGMSTYIRQLVVEDCGQKLEEENQC